MAVDGSASVNALVEPDLSVPASPATAPPSRCEFSVTGGLPALPTLPDCGAPAPALRVPILAVRSVLPSGTSADREKGQVNATALSIFSTQHPQLGWRRLATSRSNYDGQTGLQSVCMSDEGVALLEGERRTLRDRPVATWTLSWVPADPAQAGWTAPAPQLDKTIASDFNDGVRLACDGKSIYSEYTRPHRDDSLSGTTRVVRFAPPS